MAIIQRQRDVMKWPQFSIRIPEDEKKLLDDIAYQKKISTAALVRKYISEGLEKDKQDQDRDKIVILL